MRPLRVDVWSDLACPWCYVGKRRLEAAVAGLPEPAAVEVVWRAFELDPAAPRVRPEEPYAERLARKYGCAKTEAQAMVDRMTSVAAGEGLDYHFERIRPGNTFDAHRLLHLARERGSQPALKERFLRGYLCEGEPIGDPAALARLAAEAGLPPDEVRRVLSTDAYAHAVRADEEEARRLGVDAVPFFVLAGRWGVAGAQPAAVLQEALEHALRATAAPLTVEGATCGPEGCG
jgi:predicted DsbA family dithiol-disulfide isomerase